MTSDFRLDDHVCNGTYSTNSAEIARIAEAASDEKREKAPRSVSGRVTSGTINNAVMIIHYYCFYYIQHVEVAE